MRKTEKAEIARWIESNRDRIIETTAEALRIPSVLDIETVSDGAPFGRSCADALDHALAICQRNGMSVRNFDGYAGHAEFGPDRGDGYVGVLGHLDVVPVGDAWTKDPWGGEVSDGWIWGRGASDDKGPTYAALFGAIALTETGIGVDSRVRLIFGCDEESEWRCMDHYFGAAKQELPRLGFTPDAGFPLYHAEKGAITVRLSRRAVMSGIASVTSGLRANMVPDSARIRWSDEGETARSNGLGRLVRVDATGAFSDFAGKSAHGASPRKGINAAIKACRSLSRLPDGDPWAAVVELGALDASGCGLPGADALTGATTANLGVLRVADERIEATMNLRYPATWSPASTMDRLKAHVAMAGWTIEEVHHTEPLYVPIESEPVRSLMQVYRRQTGRRGRPLTMGGRTYATTIQPFGVAFGAAMAGDPDVAHRPDERFAVDRLLGCTAIYADAIRTLSRVI